MLVNSDTIKQQIKLLDDKMLFESGGYRAYLISEDDAPDIMMEIYRLREETFRLVGEGTGNEIDTDEFDKYYKHLFLWNVDNEEIVGAYRLGYVPEIICNHRIEGLYTSTLVTYGKDAYDILSHSVELGRSFITKKYQKEVLPLKLLLSGLAIAVTQNGDINYVTGVVSISAQMPERYKAMMSEFLSNKYKLDHAKDFSTPKTPFKYALTSSDEFRINNMLNTVDDVDRFIFEDSKGEWRIPVLVRKYFNCGAKVACFNVDSRFSFCLDALIVMKLCDFPEITLRSLLRILPEENKNKIFKQFYNVSHKD